MADPFATVLTHLNNLVSFRSSLRLLIIAGSIICCWVFIEPKLSMFALPRELSLTLITVIGFSLGALLFSVIFSSIDFSLIIIKKEISSRQNKLAEQKKAEEKELYNRKEIELLKKAFYDYSIPAKKILLKLKDKDGTIATDLYSGEDHNKAFFGLLDNEIVLPQHRLDKTTTFCTINPLYKDVIKQLFDEKHRKETLDLLEQNPDGLKMLLAKFKNEVNPDRFIFDISHTTYSNRYNYTPVIQNEIYEEDEFIEDCNIQFFISEHHYPFVCEMLGAEIRSYVLGKFDEERALKRLQRD